MDDTKPRRGPGRPPSGLPHKGSYSYRAESALKMQGDLKALEEGTTLSAKIEGWIAAYVKGD